MFIEARAMYRADGPEAFRVVGEVEWVNGIAAESASGLWGETRIAAGIVGTIFAIWCSYQILGRRPMILFGTMGAIICMFAAALGGTIAPGTAEAAKNFMASLLPFSATF